MERIIGDEFIDSSTKLWIGYKLGIIIEGNCNRLPRNPEAFLREKIAPDVVNNIIQIVTKGAYPKLTPSRSTET